MDQIREETMHLQFTLKEDKEVSMTEEQVSQETVEQQDAQQKSKKQNKGKQMGKMCVVCEEREGSYVRNSKPVCSGCLNGRINLSEQFFSFTLSDMVSKIEYHGFHPSPLTPPEVTGY